MDINGIKKKTWTWSATRTLCQAEKCIGLPSHHNHLAKCSWPADCQIRPLRKEAVTLGFLQRGRWVRLLKADGHDSCTKSEKLAIFRPRLEQAVINTYFWWACWIYPAPRGILGIAKSPTSFAASPWAALWLSLIHQNMSMEPKEPIISRVEGELALAMPLYWFWQARHKKGCQETCSSSVRPCKWILALSKNV